MADSNLFCGAHPSFPLTLPTLQSASLKPDFKYFVPTLARQFSAFLSQSKPSFSAGELAAIGLMGRVFLTIIQNYINSHPKSLFTLDSYIQESLDANTAQNALAEVLYRFPTPLTYGNPNQINAYSYIKADTAFFRHDFYQSLILILASENNPSIRSRDGLFTDPQLRQSPLFLKLISSLEQFFSQQSAPHSSGTTLIDFLLEPSRLHPNSLFDQLDFIRNNWSDYIDSDLLRALTFNLDFLKEECIPGPPGSFSFGSPLGHIRNGDQPDKDSAGFTPDKDWMPRVILQAKNVYVWLDQLSRAYQRPITRLDQIPDEEFDKFSKSGINALWLIGLWERSPASQKIKQMCGNPEAVSSAYALADYSIAAGLGSESAFLSLSSQADRFNIRLAADMVPNHMGIDSRWVIEHPDWFLSIGQSPFPNYSFDGVNLSPDPSVSIFLEDHYYDKSDASVVFKRVDNNNGEVRYIYHGNDGTSMPWNDTAQLNFLKPEVREAVIQTVLHVARKFPIIRFDAAMTLSKKHYQRLWFPRPGTGGAIPTRAEHGLSKKQFDASMPKEFWRELVDRIADEIPDTLLLAEAFWMMEGYFVRNLGMHRVYNSAFMHMLRDEKNKEYRKLIIDTLEFDPQILKRYVNFMNNPDEDTAVSQFGKGDKYFGTCLLMSTLPGLPMFGHGQIEGLSEKYGMEYKKAYYDETPDIELIERHRTEIFPLLHKRYLFSEADHFVLYDLVTQEGIVNEDVFIFSNYYRDERALIVYHNKWGDTRGWIQGSTPVNSHSIDLLTGLGISLSDGDYLTFKDQVTGLNYLRSIDELNNRGLFLELGAYKYHAFLDFKIETDHDGSLAILEKILDGKGSINIPKQRKEIQYRYFGAALTDILDIFQSELQLPHKLDNKIDPSKIRAILDSSSSTWQVFNDHFSTQLPDIARGIESSLISFQQRLSGMISLLYSPIAEILSSDIYLFFPWLLLVDRYPQLPTEDLEIIFSITSGALASPMSLHADDQDFLHGKLNILLNLTTTLSEISHDPLSLSDFWFSNPNTRQFIDIHDFEGKEWFNKESMESLINLSYALIFIDSIKEVPLVLPLSENHSDELIMDYSSIIKAMGKSGYQVERFRNQIKHQS